MELRAGTSGFSYDEWSGTFYPEGTPKSERLTYYARNLRTVEINNTFYQMPRVDVLERWAQQVPHDFTFILKVPRLITHQKKLADAAGIVGDLWSRADTLGEKLGPFLVQLPPYLKRDDALLRDFLAAWPGKARLAVEFRSSSWFVATVYQILSDVGAALVVSDREGERSPPVIRTAHFGYARLRRAAYDDADLDRWIQAFRDMDWKQAWVFFKHEEAGIGPGLAARLAERSDA